MQAMIMYEPNFAVKLSLAFGMFNNVLSSLGSARLMKYVEANMNAEVKCHPFLE
jgi:hypothetical protein